MIEQLSIRRSVDQSVAPPAHERKYSWARYRTVNCPSMSVCALMLV